MLTFTFVTCIVSCVMVCGCAGVTAFFIVEEKLRDKRNHRPLEMALKAVEEENDELHKVVRKQDKTIALLTKLANTGRNKHGEVAP